MVLEGVAGLHQPIDRQEVTRKPLVYCLDSTQTAQVAGLRANLPTDLFILAGVIVASPST